MYSRKKEMAQATKKKPVRTFTHFDNYLFMLEQLSFDNYLFMLEQLSLKIESFPMHCGKILNHINSS